VKEKVQALPRNQEKTKGYLTEGKKGKKSYQLDLVEKGKVRAASLAKPGRGKGEEKKPEKKGARTNKGKSACEERRGGTVHAKGFQFPGAHSPRQERKKGGRKRPSRRKGTAGFPRFASLIRGGALSYQKERKEVKN